MEVDEGVEPPGGGSSGSSGWGWMLATVMTKGGHTGAVQYAGAEKVSFKLFNWNLSVEAYPQPEEALEETSPSGSGAASK